MSSRARATDPVPEIRVLVIGYGLIGRQRAAALAQLPGARLAGTVDPAGVDPSGSTGAPHYADFGSVPPEIYDAAIVAVPHNRAVELAAAVFEAGRPALIEKPLGVTSVHAQELEELASGVPIPSFVGYNYRFIPTISKLLTLARTGALGRLRNLDLLLGHGGHPTSDESWKLDPVRAGGGVLLDPGVHLLDLLLLVAPGAECTDIQATRGFWRTGVEEDVVATFRRDNMLASVRTSHIRWVNTFRVELIGEDGYAIVEGRGGNYGAMKLSVGRRWAWSEPGAPSQRDSEDACDFGTDNLSLRDELAEVVNVWRGSPMVTGPVHPATVTEGRAVTELCERLYAQMG